MLYHCILLCRSGSIEFKKNTGPRLDSIYQLLENRILIFYTFQVYLHVNCLMIVSDFIESVYPKTSNMVGVFRACPRMDLTVYWAEPDTNG